MPNYEYECKVCGDKFEVRRGFFEKEKEKTPCPKCGSNETGRVYSIFCSATSSSTSCAPSPGRFK